MNKIRRRMSLGLILSALFALTIGFASCSNGSGIDYFTKDEVGGTITFGNTPVTAYQGAVLFDEEDLNGEKLFGQIFICDSYDNNLWKYFVQYQINFTNDYCVRRVYVKSKSDALKVYSDMENGYNRNLTSEYRSAYFYYNIDYDINVLMSNFPVSLSVRNMTGKTFGTAEIIRNRQRTSSFDGSPYIENIYEERWVFPYKKMTNGNYREGCIWITDNGKNENWPYAVFFYMDFFDSNGKWLSEGYAGVACKTKTEAKSTFKTILDAYKTNPNKFSNIPDNYKNWQAVGGAGDADPFDINTFLNY